VPDYFFDNYRKIPMDKQANKPPGPQLGHCLVTGAAGFTGRHLVEALLDKGMQVRALVRSTALDLDHPNLECFQGDICDAEAMHKACADIDTVFHTAAFIATMGGSAVSQEYRDKAFEINVGGTDNIIAACLANSVKRLVHTSSVDVCFNSEVDLQMDEHTPYATSFNCVYTETKIAAERAVLDVSGREGLLSCALRPDGIWGAGGSLMMDLLVEQLREGRMVARIGGRGALHDHVHIDNLVHAHLLAAAALVSGSPVCGKAYFISDGKPAHMFDFVRPFFEGLGYRVPRFSIPAAPVRAAMASWQWLHFKVGLAEPVFTPHELNKLTISHVISSDAAARDFGYKPIKSVEEGMADSVAYYLTGSAQSN
jgi:3beta-hydroxy-Delta5-steroid dehydrogenase / steroid Delta-isomerase